jgi:hypothetical protein
LQPAAKTNTSMPIAIDQARFIVVPDPVGVDITLTDGKLILSATEALVP